MSDFHTRLREAWLEDHGRPPNWVEEMLLDEYARRTQAYLDRIIGDTTDWRPTGFLGAADTITVETEEQRITRKFVPLVRAAAAEVPMPRAHSRALPCWCGAENWAGVIVHMDDRIPNGCNGIAFSGKGPEGWFSP